METNQQIDEKLEIYIYRYLAGYFKSTSLDTLREYLHTHIYDKSETPEIAMVRIADLLKAILFYVKLSSTTEPSDSLLSSTSSMEYVPSNRENHFKIDKNLKTTFVPKNAINGKKIKYIFDAEFSPIIVAGGKSFDVEIEFYLVEQMSNGFYGRTRYEVAFLRKIETNPKDQIKKILD